MSNYKVVVSQLLTKQYSNKSSQSIIITNLTIRFIMPPVKLIFQQYKDLKVLVLMRCDLRKLENFPVFNGLKDLDLSYNGLQGTLNYLIPLQNLQYLNLDHNYIDDVSKFLPLIRLKKLQLYIDNNPFTQCKNWKNSLRKINIKMATKQKVLINQKPKMIDKLQKQRNYSALQRQIFNNDYKKSNKVSFAQQNLKIFMSSMNNRQRQRDRMRQREAQRQRERQRQRQRERQRQIQRQKLVEGQVQSLIFEHSQDQDQQSQHINYCLMDRLGRQLQNINYQQLNSQELQELDQMEQIDQDQMNQVSQSLSQDSSS